MTTIPPEAVTPPTPTGQHQAIDTAGMSGTQKFRLTVLSMILATVGAMGGGRLVGDDSAKIAALEARVAKVEKVHSDEALLEKAMKRLGAKLDKTKVTP